jgi:hypothetical protein
MNLPHQQRWIGAVWSEGKSSEAVSLLSCSRHSAANRSARADQVTLPCRCRGTQHVLSVGWLMAACLAAFGLSSDHHSTRLDWQSRSETNASGNRHSIARAQRAEKRRHRMEELSNSGSRRIIDVAPAALRIKRALIVLGKGQAFADPLYKVRVSDIGAAESDQVDRARLQGGLSAVW